MGTLMGISTKTDEENVKSPRLPGNFLLDFKNIFLPSFSTTHVLFLLCCFLCFSLFIYLFIEILFKPEARLNPDVLELIFRHLNFKELLAVELVCKQWKEVVGNRRLYEQLAKRICSRKVNIGFTRSGFQKQLREVRRGRFKKKS